MDVFFISRNQTRVPRGLQQFMHPTQPIELNFFDKFVCDVMVLCRANDICKESKRQIISAEDVFKALEETEFPEFVRPLKASLEGSLLLLPMLVHANDQSLVAPIYL